MTWGFQLIHKNDEHMANLRSSTPFSTRGTSCCLHISMAGVVYGQQTRTKMKGVRSYTNYLQMAHDNVLLKMDSL